ALEDSLVVYMVTHNEYAPERERCVSYRHVKWPLEVAAVSDKDGRCPELARAEAFDRSVEPADNLHERRAHRQAPIR
ncbi:MAG: hypothetical protein RXS42_07135, partial [Nitrososphaeria archaeon]